MNIFHKFTNKFPSLIQMLLFIALVHFTLIMLDLHINTMLIIEIIIFGGIGFIGLLSIVMFDEE